MGKNIISKNINKSSMSKKNILVNSYLPQYSSGISLTNIIATRSRFKLFLYNILYNIFR